MIVHQKVNQSLNNWSLFFVLTIHVAIYNGVVTTNWKLDNEDTQHYSSANSEVTSRDRFKYSLRDSFHYFCCFGWIFKSQWCRKHSRNRGILRNHEMLNAADRKLTKELDLSNLILTIRELKGLVSILLSKDQKLLLELQRENVLDSEDEQTPKINNFDVWVESKVNPLYDLSGMDVIDLMNSQSSSSKQVTQMTVQNAISKLETSSKIDKTIYWLLLHRDLKGLSNYDSKNVLNKLSMVDSDTSRDKEKFDPEGRPIKI